MDIEGVGSRELKLGVVVVLFVAVVGGAYLVFAEQESVEISNAEELQNMKNDLDADYVLVDDIDASEIENFEPIGDFDRPFVGTFDGNGHTISNLTIHRPNEEGVGLFGYVDGVHDARISNVGLKDVGVTGRTLVGGLVGNNYNGEVQESYVTGEVEGNIMVGGIVGRNVGLTSPGTGEVVDSYSETEVSGNESVGGIIGYNNGWNMRSYAVGEITGNADIGGLVGYQVGSGVTTVRDSYWDINSTVQKSSAGGTGLTTAEMTGSSARENMDGFNFGGTWRTTEDGYPRLAWEVSER